MRDFQQTITSLDLLHTSLYRMELFINAHAVKNAKTDVISLISRLEKAERERDELKGQIDSGFWGKMAAKNLARAKKAEVELARRDAAAGEPVVWIAADALNMPRHAEIKVVTIPYVLEYPVGLCLVAPPAVLPPAVLPTKCADELKERADLIEAYSKTQCEIAQELGCDSDNESILKAIYEIKALGAQQQKVVAIPDFSDSHITHAIITVLEAAGVKWEVKS